MSSSDNRLWLWATRSAVLAGVFSVAALTQSGETAAKSPQGTGDRMIAVTEVGVAPRPTESVMPRSPQAEFRPPVNDFRPPDIESRSPEIKARSPEIEARSPEIEARLPRAEARPPEADARLSMARRYENGEGVERDFALARELYCALAYEGSAAAAHHLGWMYLNARGVERDDDMAATWLNIAAERGHQTSRNLLRTLPGAKRDVERDCPQDQWQVESVEELERRAPDKVKELAELWGEAYDLDPYLVLAVIAVESGFQTKAVSHKSAMGLMQLIPATAARFGVKDVFDPSENVRAGSEYLRWLLDHFDGDLKLALAGYNAGENKVLAYSGVPPYPETIGYIEKIRGLYAHPHLEPDGKVLELYPRSIELARTSLVSSHFLSSGLAGTPPVRDEAPPRR